jgi:general secretion pathway protein D
LVVTDYKSNLRRIEQVIKAIDLPSADAPILIPVQNASAMDIATTINKLMPEASTAATSGDGNQRFVLMGDARSNSLLLRADNPGRIARVRELVAKLDNDGGSPGNVHVVTLRNADATKLAQTLRSVMSGDTSSPVATNSQAAPTGAGIVQADAYTNSLIITASEPIFKNLRSVIERLDVRRPQVFVEALIVEVTADKAAEFGVQWQTLTGNAGNRIVGGTNFGSTGNIVNLATSPNPTLGTGLNIGVVNGSSNVPGVGEVLNLGMLARALETDSNANILSSPNLLTLDNEEAKIVVGQNVLSSRALAQSAGPRQHAFQTIERKDRSDAEDTADPRRWFGALQIYQEVSNVVTGVANRQASPTSAPSSQHLGG